MTAFIAKAFDASEPRDDQGRWTSGGADMGAARTNFLGRLGHSFVAGWNSMTPTEKTATIGAIGAGVGWSAAHLQNHISPHVHAQLTDALNRAAAYASSGKGAMHAATAASMFKIGAKFLQTEFPAMAGHLKGLSTVFAAAAASATLPKVGKFLGDIALRLASHPIAKNYKRPSGKSLVHTGGPIINRRGYKVRGNAGALQPFLPKSPFLRT